MTENIYPPPPFGHSGNRQWPIEGGAAPERGIDLNEQLVANRPATFFLRVNSDAMAGAGIQKGDMVIVDRSLEAASGRVVIAVVDGELLIRRLEMTQQKKLLIPATARLAPLDITSSVTCTIWGVVTYVIRSM